MAQRAWNQVNRCIAIAAAIIAVPSTAAAHSFAIYVSTPVSPPAPFWWYWPIAVGVLVGSVTLTLRCFGALTWLRSLAAALLISLTFFVGFYLLGWIWANSSTAPPAGLGPPSGVYCRLGSCRIVSLFVLWNFVGAALLVASILLFRRLWRTVPQRHSVAILIVPAAVYGLLLVPFIVTGALAHGWAGGYVMRAGDDQLADINRACYRYARDHSGRLPVATDIHELLPSIEKYLTQEQSRYGNPFYIHPAAWAFEKEPKPYVWNSDFSGARAPRLPAYEEHQIPVKCPYTGYRPIFDLDEDRP